MSTSAKALVARYFEMWNSGDTDIAGDILAPDWTDHAHPEIEGVAGVQAAVRDIRAARPNLRFRIDSVLAEDDRVAVVGGVGPLPPGTDPGNLVWLIRVADGRLAEMWTYTRT
jgi:ketosteroid isomerase-like protein